MVKPKPNQLLTDYTIACEQAHLFGQGVASKGAGEKNAFDRDTLSKQVSLLSG